MEAVLATLGSILLLFSVGFGALAKALPVGTNQTASAGDRIGAVVIGIGLIGTAVVLRIDAPTISLVTTFGVTAGLALLYSLYLFLTWRG